MTQRQGPVLRPPRNVAENPGVPCYYNASMSLCLEAKDGMGGHGGGAQRRTRAEGLCQERRECCALDLPDT